MAVVRATALSGLTTGYQAFFAQVRNTVVTVNGIDTNRIYHLEKGGLELGMTVPAAPSVAANGTGLTGAYRYRVKWHDRITGTMSLSSSETSITLTNQGARISQPASPPSRATHWIVERVTADGSKFFPVNINTTTPYGTVIATTTYDDSLIDRLLRQVTLIPNTQAKPPVMRNVFAHNNRVFGMGGIVYQGMVTTTNGSPTVTGTNTNFTSNLADMFFTVIGSTTGKIYRVLSVASTTQLTLTENIQSGDVVTSGQGLIFPYRNRLWWSEAGFPEHFGTQEAGGPSNEIGIGSRGEVLVAGESFGQNGVIVASDKTLYYLSYQDNPSPILGDGRIVPMPTKRHAAGPRSLAFIEGYMYGIDRFGIWRMAPNGRPEDISASLQYDFKSVQLSTCDCAKWHIQYDAMKHWVKFYVTSSSAVNADFPDRCFIWDTDTEKFVMEREYPCGIATGCAIEDRRGNLRSGIWQQAPSSTSTIAAQFYCDDEGVGYGIPSTSTPLYGTVSSGTTSSFIDTASNNWGLIPDGVPVVFYDASVGAYFTRIINDSGAVFQQLNFEPVLPNALEAGDSYWIGPMLTKLRTGQLTAGDPTRKKKWIGVRIPVKYKTSAVPFNVRAYFDGSDVAAVDQVYTSTTDGVTVTISTADKVVDPTVNEFTYYVPLNGIWANSLTIEFYSFAAGKPWEVNGPITVDFERDPSDMPAAKE